jgi:anti-sigma factor RsiW
MHEKMQPLLNAYLDGELHGQRLREMETHLASCAVCRNELRELRLVSDLLQSDPGPQVTSTEHFVSQLTLSLPRRTLGDRSPKPSTLVWWLIPVGLLGALFFVQTVFTLTDLVSAANMAGLLGHAASWLSNGGQESLWFSTATSLIVGQAAGSQPTLSLLNNVSVFAANMLGGFIWQAVIVLLYWAWLFFWLQRRGPRLMKMGNAS